MTSSINNLPAAKGTTRDSTMPSGALQQVGNTIVKAHRNSTIQMILPGTSLGTMPPNDNATKPSVYSHRCWSIQVRMHHTITPAAAQAAGSCRFICDSSAGSCRFICDSSAGSCRFICDSSAA
jgi:hypothetical protein